MRKLHICYVMFKCICSTNARFIKYIIFYNMNLKINNLDKSEIEQIVHLYKQKI